MPYPNTDNTTCANALDNIQSTQVSIAHLASTHTRVKVLQVAACYLEPYTDFNPILLKPSSDMGAQVIVHSKALTPLEASAFFGPKSKNYKAMALKAVLNPSSF